MSKECIYFLGHSIYMCVCIYITVLIYCCVLTVYNTVYNLLLHNGMTSVKKKKEKGGGLKSR